MGFYEEYLRGSKWQQKRELMLDWANHRCQQCGYDETLEVHHRTYDRLGNERIPHDLEVLCSPCHALLHGRTPRGMSAIPLKRNRFERQQVRTLELTLREVLGEARKSSNENPRDSQKQISEITELLNRISGSQSRHLPSSRKRRAKRMKKQRLSAQRNEPSAEWEQILSQAPVMGHSAGADAPAKQVGGPMS